MARFPLAEADIITLAQGIMAGLKAQPDTFPQSPIDAITLSAKLATFLQTRDAVTAAEAAVRQAVQTKQEAMEDLTDDMKAILRYAENTVNFDDAKLQTLGWGGRREKTTLQPPGQCRLLEAPRQGGGWVFLDWKEPVDGGIPSAYKVQSRIQGIEIWNDVGVAVVSEITLANQERGKTYEYRAIALNKAGEGPASNTVEVVL